MSRMISLWRSLGFGGAVLAVLAIASPVHAQAIVQGKVVDAQGQPVQGATVSIVSSENNRKFELQTDDNGEYFQIGLPPGPYTITVQKGALQAQGPVNATSNRPSRSDFTLAPAAAAAEAAATEALKLLVAEANDASAAGDHRTAIAKYTEVAAGVPGCSDCYEFIGREHVALKEYAAAEVAFKEAVALAPDNAAAYNGLANVYNAQKKFDLAAEASAKAAQLSSGGAAAGGDPDAFYNQGVVAWNAGRTEEARGHFEAALKANPDHAPSHFQLGMAMVNSGSLPEAKSEFETYLKLDPGGQFAAQAQAMIAAIP